MLENRWYKKKGTIHPFSFTIFLYDYEKKHIFFPCEIHSCDETRWFSVENKRRKATRNSPRDINSASGRRLIVPDSRWISVSRARDKTNNLSRPANGTRLSPPSSTTSPRIIQSSRGEERSKVGWESVLLRDFRYGYWTGRQRSLSLGAPSISYQFYARADAPAVPNLANLQSFVPPLSNPYRSAIALQAARLIVLTLPLPCALPM